MYNEDWSKRQKITIDHTKVTSGDHTDFPILLSDGNFLDDVYANAASDAKDLRFSSDEDGNTPLAFEVVGWNSAGKTGEVWVKIPTLSSSVDTVIYCWYKNSGAVALAEDDTYGAQNVWTNGFQAVWHLSDLHDSTANGYDLTAENSPSTTTSNVKIGTGYSFNGSNQSLYIASAPNCKITGSQTWQAWAKFNSVGSGGGQKIISLNNGGDSGLANTDVGGWGSIVGAVGLSTNQYCRNANQDTNVNRFVGRYDSVGQTLASFFNKNKASVTASGSLTSDDNRVSIGKTNSNVYYFGGNIDEVRVVNGARSDGWLDTEYDNQNSPGTFSTGSETTDIAPPPKGVIII